jgi:hypothetical protein
VDGERWQRGEGEAQTLEWLDKCSTADARRCSECPMAAALAVDNQIGRDACGGN